MPAGRFARLLGFICGKCNPTWREVGDMPSRIAEHYRDRGLAMPASKAHLIRSIIESLRALVSSASTLRTYKPSTKCEC